MKVKTEYELQEKLQEFLDEYEKALYEDPPPEINQKTYMARRIIQEFPQILESQ